MYYLDAKSTTNGKVSFPKLTDSRYLIKAYKDGVALPTYYGDQLLAENSPLLNYPMADNDNTITVNLQPTLSDLPDSNKGVISGVITTTTAKAMAKKVQRQCNETPIYNLYLENTTTKTIIAHTQSTIDGTYRFTNVPNGQYKIWLVVEGKKTININVVEISDDKLTIDNADYSITNTGVVGSLASGIEEITNSREELKIFPNSATVQLTILGAKNIDKVIIYSLLGYQMTLPISNGTIDISQLTEGIYIIEAKEKKITKSYGEDLLRGVPKIKRYRIFEFSVSRFYCVKGSMLTEYNRSIAGAIRLNNRMTE